MSETHSPMRLYFGWSLGTLAMSSLLNTQTAMLMVYLISAVGIAPAVAGGLVFVSKIYDGITDPVMGIISDRTNSRWGRRRPYLLAGGILAALSVIGLFSVHTVTFAHTQVWILTMLLAAATAYTIFNVPYMSMPAEMVQDSYERSKLMSFRVAWIAVGTFVGIALAPKLVAYARDTMGIPETEAFAMMSLITAAIILLASVACFITTRHAASTERTRLRVPLKEQARSALSNRPFLILLCIKYLGLYALSATVATNIFFVRQVMQQSEAIMLWYGLAYMVGTLAAITPWVLISKRLSKAHTLALSAAMAACVNLTWLLSGPGEPIALYMLRAFVLAVSNGGMLLMGQSLLPDVMEYDYRKTGLRREGFYAGIYSFVEKLAFATAPLTLGVLLSTMGFVPGLPRTATQPQSALFAITLAMAVIPSITNALKVLLALQFRLPEPLPNELHKPEKAV